MSASAVLDVLNPATEEVLTRQALASAEEVDQAVAAARAAAPAWRAVSPGDRARVLRRLAGMIDDHREELAQLETANVGKPIASSRGEVGAAAEVFHYYAGSVDKHVGDTVPVAGGVAMTFHEPLGVVGLITPWNFPLLIASWKLGPALACGNTVVLKPSELTPLTTVRLGELALEAGLPEGVLEVVVGTGPEAGWRLVEHPDVAKIGFTGSTAVGRRIMAGCAEQVKRVTLELGGKSANIVFADADLDAAAAAAPYAVFDNTGQDCCARSRVLVERPVFERFVSRLVDAAAGVVVGDPLAESTEVGPLVSAAHRSKVEGFVDGVEVAFRGSVPDGPGFWFPCTVVAPVDPASPLFREEIFGPVVAVLPFDDEADAIAIANDSAYGLSTSTC
jgi:betaine-aldehyde dehydrogenase